MATARDSSICVLVSGISSTLTEKQLELFFGSENKSGGGKVQDIQYNQSYGKAIIIFEDANVAPRVAERKEVEYKSCKMTLSLIDVKRTVLITGPSDITHESLELVYESKKKSNGGPVESIALLCDTKALITFEKEEDADNVLQKKTLVYREKTYTADLPNLAPSDLWDRKSVQVTGIDPDKIDKDDIELIYEHNELSGGGRVKEVIIQEQDCGLAIVVFENEADAASVLTKKSLEWEGCTLVATRPGRGTKTLNSWKQTHHSKPLTFLGSKLEHKMMDPEQASILLEDEPSDEQEQKVEKETDLRSCAIEVSALSNDISEEQLYTFFEVEKFSGGGKIETLLFLTEVGKAVITFISANVPERVQKKYLKEGFQLENKYIRVQMLHSICSRVSPVPALIKVICVKNLPADVESADIKLYLESNCKSCTVSEINFGSVPSAVLVKFNKRPDYDELYKLAVRKPLQTNMIDIIIPETSKIEVHGIDELTKQKLQLYFEHTRSNGGDVLDVEILKTDDCAVVEFQSKQTVSKVCSKGDHSCMGHTLKVRPHYDCVGLIQDESHSSIKDVSVSVSDDRIVTFILKKDMIKSSIENDISELGGIIAWDKILSSTITIQRDPKTKCTLKGKKWQDEVKREFTSIMERFKIEDFIFPDPDGWQDFVQAIDKLNLNLVMKDMLDVTVHTDTHFISVVGKVDAVITYVKELNLKKDNILDELEKKKSIVSESVKRDSYKLKLLQMHHLQDKIEQGLETLRVEIDVHQNVVTFTGTQSDIKAAKDKMDVYLKCCCRKTIKLSGFIFKFFSSWSAADYVQKKLQANNLEVFWETLDRNSEVNVYALNDFDLSSTVSIIKSSILEESIATEQDTSLLDSSRWASYQETLMSKYNGKVRVFESSETSKRVIHVVGLDDVLQLAAKDVKHFLNDNTLYSEVVTMPGVKATYIQKYCESILNGKVQQNKKYKLSIKFNSDGRRPGFIVECNKDGVSVAKTILKNLETSITSQDHTVKKPGLSKYFYEGRGQNDIIALQHQHKVIIQIDSQITNSGSLLRSAVIKLKTKFPCGSNLYIANGDLTSFDVDVIVNAADPLLQHGGGVAKAIVDRGGKEIQDECTRYMRSRNNTELHPGEVYVSTAGTLSCKHVIHTVGPKWFGGTADEQIELFHAVSATFVEATNMHMETLAMTAISTGKYGFPVKEACQILIAAISGYLSEGRHSLRDVYIVDNNKEIIDACQQALNDHGIPFTSIDGNDDSSIGATGGLGMQSSPTGNVWNKGITKHQITTAEGLRISLESGSIVDMKTDVIVNLTSSNLDLKNGVVSQQILKKAGSSIQKECAQKAPRGVSAGDVVVTSGGNEGSWKMICHGTCSAYSSPSAVQELKDYIKICLIKAHEKKMTSIAMASMGTGSLQFPPKEVAKMMFCEVKEFSDLYKTTTLQDIIFVVFDKPIYHEFENHMQYLLTNPLEDTSTRRHVEPTGTMFSEWKKGSGRNNEVVTSQGVSVKIYQGQITDHQVEVIVNLTSRELDLSAGAVSSSILKAAGKAIQDECKKKKPPGIGCGELFVSGAGKMSCKNIYHGACSIYSQTAGQIEMEMYISACLERAHQDGIKSLAFPSLGTGSLGFPEKTIATLMYSEIKKFSLKHSNTSLKEIRFVIFDKKVLKVFESVAHSLPGKSRTLARKPTGFDGKLGIKTFLSSWHKNTSPPNKKTRTRDINKEVNFRIYGTEVRNIKQVITEINKLCESEVTTTVLDKAKEKEAVSKLTSEQVAHILELENAYDVQIKIENGTTNKIIIQGSGSVSTEVVRKITQIFDSNREREKDELEMDYIRNQAQWQYKEDSIWEDYPPEINAIIEKANKENKKFAQWDEKDSVTHKDVTIRLDFTQRTEYSTQDPSRKFEVRQRLEAASSSTLPLPPEWVDMKSGQKLLVVKVQKGSQEYQKVEQEFDSSMKKVSGASYSSIVEIRRVQNPLLYKSFVARKEHMISTNAYSKNPCERSLWHATGEEVLQEINTNGFDRNFSGDKHGAWYGKGVYFASHAGLSAKAYSGKGSGNKYIYKCKVLTGDYVKENRHATIKAAPPKDPKNPAIKYDSVVDDDKAPNEWIIFNDSGSYPEYIIVFTK